MKHYFIFHYTFSHQVTPPIYCPDLKIEDNLDSPTNLYKPVGGPGAQMSFEPV